MLRKIISGVIILIVGIIIFFTYKSQTVLAPSDMVSLSSTPSQTINSENPIFDKSRVTKKPFGIYITPQNSPVQPEKFTGYHTGVDFETTSAEVNIDVPVTAFCDGKLLMKKYATGYGGVAVQSCVLNNESVTVIYGHLKLASITATAGQTLKKGDLLGVLGKGYSTETNGERKHLHFGIHIGVAVNILGYVQKQSDLSGWLDSAQFIK